MSSKNIPSIKPPYLGAAYYPEAWPLQQIDEDIRLMKEVGINVARVAEFAWSCLEPEEGQYDFEWLHLAVNKLTEAGIAVVMCTPTATPPIWLTTRYPEVLIMNDSGMRAQHGARKHTCPNSPVYRRLSQKIVTRMAREFGNNDNIIGWQIDNEFYPQIPNFERGCCCPVCHRKFQEKMELKYGTIESLNNAWGTNLWSQTYQSFAQLPIPRKDIWHHPSLITSWMVFQSDSLIEFSDFQGDILHKLTKHPVGTDMMPFGGLNYYQTNKNLDMVQFNHYNNMKNLWEAVFWFDFLRPIKDAPFWNTETGTCWAGATATDGYKAPGFCKVNSWLPIALGGEANLYWLWRSHWSGQELMHGPVVSSCGRKLHVTEEVTEISEGFSLASDFLSTTQPKKTGMAIHFSGWAWWFFEYQPLVGGFKYLRELLNKVYQPILQSHLRPDIIDPAASLDSYKVVYSPFLPALSESNLQERLEEWIENGGTWIVGPMSDIRTMDATKFKHAPFGVLEDWGGVYCAHQIPGNSGDFSFVWNFDKESSSSLWHDGFELKGATPLATYTEGPLKGLAAITHKKMGKGNVIILGTCLEAIDLQNFLLGLCATEGIMPVADASPNLLVVPREGKDRGLVLLEIEHKPGQLRLDKKMTDLLTGQEHHGEVEVAPYTVMVLKECVDEK